MVAPAGAETRADRVRCLNLPRPVQVTVDAQSEVPVALVQRNRRRAIECVQDSWDVDDEWWRDPISRYYIRVILRDGAIRTLFHDRIADRWFAQEY